MSPTDSEPTTQPRPDDVEDTTVPPPEPEPIPMPGPDPTPEPLPRPGPDPAPPPGPDPRPGPIPQPPGPDPVPQPGPDPVPEPGPVAGAVPQAVATDEGSAELDDDAAADEVVPEAAADAPPDLELAVHEQPEAEVEVVRLDDDVDVELDVEPADDRYLDDLDGTDEGVLTAAAVAVVEPAPPALAETLGGPLLPDAGVWEERWTAVQAGFVDDPGRSIQQADRLVTEAMEELARILLARREKLQHQWRTGDDAPPDTEQLRKAVQGYRALLFGLLSA